MSRRRPDRGRPLPIAVTRKEGQMGRILRENGLSIVLFGLFAVFLIGQTIAGRAMYNQQRERLGLSQVDYPGYLATGHNIEAIFENWESEFLQMGSNVVLAIFLFQKGSAASKKLDGSSDGGPGPEKPAGPDAPWPARRGGWVRTLYANSLPLAFFVLFALSFWLHAVGGRLDYNEQMARHDGTPVSLAGFLGTSTFWFQSLQNYQSEFLSLGSMVVLTIFLRQAGSPRSKPVDAPMAQTGH
jgi:hypothetical protein